MKVHLIRKESIQSYASRNAQSKTPFGIWLTTIKFADWNAPDDMKGTFAAADKLAEGSKMVIFNIGGNDYRMNCKYALEKSRFTYLLFGLEHMLNMISFVKRESSTQ